MAGGVTPVSLDARFYACDECGALLLGKTEDLSWLIKHRKWHHKELAESIAPKLHTDSAGYIHLYTPGLR